MTDLFIKNGSKDAELARNAAPGDLDMIISSRDGALVVVAQMGGAHVCGRCLEQFVNDPGHELRGVEWNPPDGLGTRMLLHACCVNPAKQYGGNLIDDRVRAHQAKRLVTRATAFTRPSDGAGGTGEER
jgi:hypothetical protein